MQEWNNLCPDCVQPPKGGCHLCCCDEVEIELEAPEQLGCGENTIAGVVLCDGDPLKGVKVLLSSDIPSITFPQDVITDKHGLFRTNANVTGTPPNTTGNIFARVVNCGNSFETQQTVTVCCCEITLNVPANVDCSGADIAGTVTCGSTPVPNVSVLLTADPDVVTFSQNPVNTDMNGSFSVGVTANNGIAQAITTTITANTTTATGCAQTISSDPVDISVCCCSPSEFISLMFLGCQTEISGQIFCSNSGSPAANVRVDIEDDSEGVVTYSENPTFTDQNGNFSMVASVPEATGTLSVTFNSFVTVCGQRTSIIPGIVSVFNCQ